MENRNGPESFGGQRASQGAGQENTGRAPDEPPGPPEEPRAARFFRGLVTLAFLTVLVAVLLRHFGLQGLLSIGLVAVGLGFVILIHEFGHFAVAKLCDVHVQAFSIGFGPAIPGCSFRRGETVYQIAWIPLGGYVKMVGEGSEEPDSADDPRSFKNKPVWQRLAIVSAGVTMNVLLGFVCFIVVYTMHGVERQPAVVGMVDAGSPAWQQGLPSGAVIRQIDGYHNPYFDDLQLAVAFSSEGQPVTFVYDAPEQPDTLREVKIVPKRLAGSPRPLIGIAPPSGLKLPPRGIEDLKLPVLPGSAAARAEPPFEFGDTIVGCTDPGRPDRVEPLEGTEFELSRRLERLAGKPMVIQVRRKGAKPDQPPVDVHVPPAYHHTFGLRMAMGQVAAVRAHSPAAAAGVRPHDENQDGDVIEQVEVAEPDGTTTRYQTAPGGTAPKGTKVKDLDPLRLPSDLAQWARRKTGPKQVTVVVRRRENGEGRPVTLKLPWDENWQLDQEVPFSNSAPEAIPALGLAYWVRTTVAAVDEQLPDGQKGPAAGAGIRAGDVIAAIRLRGPDEEGEPARWVELKPDQWAHVFWSLQDVFDFKDIKLRVKRGDESPEFTLSAVPDSTWPQARRGLILMPARRLQKAQGVGQAIGLGLTRTYRFIGEVYQGIAAMATGRVSPKMMSGPIGIARMAYAAASNNIFTLIFFLGLISVNLAVINFLPIPVLDGGHVVFLAYEKICGRPPSEAVRNAATIAGLAVILMLVAFSVWVDVF